MEIKTRLFNTVLIGLVGFLGFGKTLLQRGWLKKLNKYDRTAH